MPHPPTPKSAAIAASIRTLPAAAGASDDTIARAAAFIAAWAETRAARSALTDPAHRDHDIDALVRAYCAAHPPVYPELTGPSAGAPKDRVLVLQWAGGEFFGRWDAWNRVWAAEGFGTDFLRPEKLTGWREVEGAAEQARAA